MKKETPENKKNVIFDAEKQRKVKKETPEKEKNEISDAMEQKQGLNWL